MPQIRQKSPCFLGGGADHGVAIRLCHNFHLLDVYYCGTGRLSLPVSHMKRLRVERWWIVLGTLVATVTVAACDGSVTDLDDPITYEVTSFAIAESFPVQVSVTVEITNTATTPASVTFPDGCVVLMRAYDDGTEPAWDMSGAVGCTQALVQVDLGPGDSEEFQTGLVSAATILGDSLPNGNYRITAYLRPGRIVELDVGSVDLAVP